MSVNTPEAEAITASVARHCARSSSSLAKPWNRQRDQLRTSTPQLCEIEAQPGHDTRPEIFNHDIGTGDEFASLMQPLWRFQIQPHAQFVAIKRGICRAIPERPSLRVDMYDSRSQISEDHRYCGACDVLSEIDDINALQRQLVGVFHDDNPR
ncbi:hypothetical protein PPS11_03795 [Pseudomonas putida S11]|nr:hypothetical protein PPS11_03795 [Pseudomonas putida S11]